MSSLDMSTATTRRESASEAERGESSTGVSTPTKTFLPDVYTL